MGSNGSFYQSGLPLGGVNSGVGNVAPGAPTPKPANSSFYLSGSVYATLQNSDALLAAITAQQVLASAAAVASQASNVASGASATSAAASAAAAIVTLASSLLKANNLSDLTNVATAKTNLSLVKADVGLGNVDNTSDVNKPVSTAQAAADALKANIASPTFTGVAAAPTATAGTNTTQLATTAFVEAARVILAAATALKADNASPGLTGTPTAPTASPGTNTTQLATTAFVDAARVLLAAATALKADIASPTFTGTPAAPTAAALTNTTQLATTAFVDAARVVLAAATALKADIASPTFTGVPAAPTAAALTNTTQLATTAFVTAAVAAGGGASDPSLARGYLAGLTLSTAGASTTYGIALGVAVDSGAANFMKLTSAYTKTTAAWAVGTATGSLDTGTIAASTWYHVFLIKRLDTLVVDVLISLSPTAPTLPTNYTVFRRIGTMSTDASSQWRKFVQIGDEFLWSTAINDVNNVDPGTTGANYVLAVPSGITVKVDVECNFTNTAAGSALYVESTVTDVTASGVGAGFELVNSVATRFASARLGLWTTARNIHAVSTSASGNSFYATTFGWTDPRGRI